jgi:hypothetical protein
MAGRTTTFNEIYFDIIHIQWSIREIFYLTLANNRLSALQQQFTPKKRKKRDKKRHRRQQISFITLQKHRTAIRLQWIKPLVRNVRWYTILESGNNGPAKSYFFWDTTQCDPLKVNRLFGGTSSAYYLFDTAFFDFFDPEDRGDILLRNFGWLFKGLHGVMPQKI